MPTSPSTASSTSWNYSRFLSITTKCTIFCKKCVKKLAVSSEMCYFVPQNEKTSIMQQLNAYVYSYYYFTLTR